MRPLLLSIALVTACAAPSTNDVARTSNRAAALSRQVQSPFCPGKTLYDCSSSQAALWRADVSEWLGEGMSEERIIGRLQARTPDFDLTPPTPTPGLFWFSWIVASVVLLFGATRLVRRRPADIEDDELELDDAYDTRLNELLED